MPRSQAFQRGDVNLSVSPRTSLASSKPLEIRLIDYAWGIWFALVYLGVPIAILVARLT